MVVFLLNYVAVTEWIPKWKINGWKTINGANVKNREDLEKLQEVCSKINVKWVSSNYIYTTYLIISVYVSMSIVRKLSGYIVLSIMITFIYRLMLLVIVVFQGMRQQTY